jgi:hypothetical protein
VTSAGVAGSDDACVVGGGRRLRRGAQFSPVRGRRHAGGGQKILTIIPDADVDAPRQRDIMAIVFQRVDRAGQKIIGGAVAAQLRDHIVDRQDRVRIVRKPGNERFLTGCRPLASAFYGSIRRITLSRRTK